MQVAVFSTKPYDRRFLDAANAAGGDRHRPHYLEPRLSSETAVLARGAGAVCAFVNDVADEAALEALSGMGMRLLVLRSAGFNNVDLPAARRLGIAVARMRRGAMLVNTSRGAIVDTRAVIAGLKSCRIGLLGLDVYEEEADLFFEDLSDQVIHDDVFARLLTFPNVLVTAHQAFFTEEALTAIAETTIANISAFEDAGRALHEVSTERIA